MTNVIYIHDAATAFKIDSNQPPRELLQEIRENRWKIPPSIASLWQGDLPIRLTAIEQNDTVIIAPDVPLKNQSKAKEKPPLKLSPQQTTVLQYLADGYSVKEIAFMMGLHIRTVQHHLAKVKSKFGTRSTAQTLFQASSLGLIHPKY